MFFIMHLSILHKFKKKRNKKMAHEGRRSGGGGVVVKGLWALKFTYTYAI